ncbi:hypothetical protein CALCODRAFT_484865 [Calocera cornea HHB12733]|uniref:Uncharacterized protein n=1 Tax=Calocera cornea HHB12733 TaxID=1353952 RepID=A0A165EQ54_9BASI|nr:hypothetical protein CALCODRAFT_484865 [Calocera cornea HHB12733]
MIDAKAQSQVTTAYFNELNATFGQHHVERWKRHQEHVTESHGKFTSVYKFPEDAVPTQQQVVDRLRDDDTAASTTFAVVSDSVGRVGAVSFIQLGIALQEHQLVVKRKLQRLADTDPEELEIDVVKQDSLRATLLPQLQTWRILQLREMPLLSTGDSIPPVSADGDLFPEEEELGLPSSFDAQARRSLKLDGHAAIELKLRMAQAEEAIGHLIEALKLQHVYRQNVRTAASAPGVKTRARKTMELQNVYIKRHADTYRRARNAMIRLGLSVEHAQYRDLRDEDLSLGDDPRNRRKLGFTSISQRWFCSLRKRHGSDVEEPTTSWSEAERVPVKPVKIDMTTFANSIREPESPLLSPIKLKPVSKVITPTQHTVSVHFWVSPFLEPSSWTLKENSVFDPSTSCDILRHFAPGQQVELEYYQRDIGRWIKFSDSDTFQLLPGSVLFLRSCQSVIRDSAGTEIVLEYEGLGNLLATSWRDALIHLSAVAHSQGNVKRASLSPPMVLSDIRVADFGARKRKRSLDDHSNSGYKKPRTGKFRDVEVIDLTD